MKIAIIHDNARHAVRLLDFFPYTGLDYHIYNNSSQFGGGNYDLLLIESGITSYIKDKVSKSSKIVFYDCEDDPQHFEPQGPFYELLDSASAYAKMVFKRNSPVCNLPHISLPLSQYLMYRNICDVNRNKTKDDSVFFNGAPTFIGKYNYKYPDGLSLDSNNFVVAVNDTDWIYGQRYHWLSQLYNSKINVLGGIVFKSGVESLEWQTQMFGERVKFFNHSPISYNHHINACLTIPISINPTGYDRISFRTFDLMSAGNIILNTDIGDREMLYLPIFTIPVGDKDLLIEKYHQVVDNFNELLTESEVNREVFKNITPERIWTKFLNQLYS